MTVYYNTRDSYSAHDSKNRPSFLNTPKQTSIREWTMLTKTDMIIPLKSLQTY